MSHFTFKRLVPGGFNLGFIGANCTALPRHLGGVVLHPLAGRLIPVDVPEPVDQGRNTPPFLGLD